MVFCCKLALKRCNYILSLFSIAMEKTWVSNMDLFIIRIYRLLVQPLGMVHQVTFDVCFHSGFDFWDVGHDRLDSGLF